MNKVKKKKVHESAEDICNWLERISKHSMLAKPLVNAVRS